VHSYHDFILPLFLSYIVYQGVRPAAEAERPGSSGKKFIANASVTVCI
jgi:hypothetical protein